MKSVHRIVRSSYRLLELTMRVNPENIELPPTVSPRNFSMGWTRFRSVAACLVVSRACPIDNPPGQTDYCKYGQYTWPGVCEKVTSRRARTGATRRGAFGRCEARLGGGRTSLESARCGEIVEEGVPA